MPVLCRPLSQLFSLLMLISLGAASSHAAADDGNESASKWQSSEFILRFEKPAAAQVTYPWLEQLRGIMLRSLNSPDQARDLTHLHNALGTKALANYAKYV